MKTFSSGFSVIFNWQLSVSDSRHGLGRHRVAVVPQGTPARVSQLSRPDDVPQSTEVGFSQFQSTLFALLCYHTILFLCLLCKSIRLNFTVESRCLWNSINFFSSWYWMRLKFNSNFDYFVDIVWWASKVLHRLPHWHGRHIGLVPHLERKKGKQRVVGIKKKFTLFRSLLSSGHISSRVNTLLSWVHSSLECALLSSSAHSSLECIWSFIYGPLAIIRISHQRALLPYVFITKSGSKRSQSCVASASPELHRC